MARAALACLALLLTAGCIAKTQSPAPVIEYGLRGGAGSAGMHTVANGETVFEIAKRYRLPMQDIIGLNDIPPPYRLVPGGRLRLPPPNEYTVKSGDTLYTIGRTFDVSVNGIARLNDLPPPYSVQKGQVLRLPSPVVSPSPSPSQLAQGPSLSFEGEGLGEGIRQPQPVEREPLFPPQPRTQSAASAPVPKMPDTVPPRAGTKFLWPVEGKVISGFGPKADGLHNDGINIKAPRGAPVRAAENGVIVYADDALQGYGNLILIRHADGWMTAYAHLDKTLAKKGDTVQRGQSVGTVGATGSVSTPQLHFEVRKGTEAINPQKYL